MDHPYPPYYDTHLFCCTNEREKGHARGCCKERGGAEIRSFLKKRIKSLKLPRKVRVNASGCLDRCELGPVIVVYPEGIWYHCPDEAAAERIVQEHILGGVPVKELMLHPRQKRLEQKFD